MHETSVPLPISLLRVARGLTQADLAAAVDVSPATMSDIERRRRQPSAGVRERIAKALGCPLAALDGHDFAVVSRSGGVDIVGNVDQQRRPPVRYQEGENPDSSPGLAESVEDGDRHDTD